MLATKLLSAMAGGEEKLYVDDVFSAYTYTGNGTTQTINNGIDLAGKGGLVWGKRRNSTTHHLLYDDVRGITQYLCSDTLDTTYDEGSSAAITSFNSNGFSLSSQAGMNFSGATYVSWTFRKAPKFFDVVTYTGDGTSNKAVSHSLGSVPGCILVKKTSAAGTSWAVYHRSLGYTQYLVLDSTQAASGGSGYWYATPTSTQFYVGDAYSDGWINASGATYVAYLFAHDPSADGIVQCGSFTTDGSGTATVNLGWEPQYVMLKRTNTTGSWWILDSARGLTAGVGSTDKYLLAESSSAEAEYSIASPTATGFSVETMGTAATYIYLAIRRPNKPPTVGTQVYNAIARTGTGAAATVTGVGFAPDLLLSTERTKSFGVAQAVFDRLRGYSAYLVAQTTSAESVVTNALANFNAMDGISVLDDSTKSVINNNTKGFISHFFKRAPGVFDVVCYTETNASLDVPHSLGVAPELVITKRRDTGTSDWSVWYAGSPLGSLCLEQTAGNDNIGLNWMSPTSTKLVAMAGTSWNYYVGAKRVAYLFASLPGISKVGSYTGNGTSQTIDCGFTTGARFVVIKRTDSTGDWYVWDTARGIVSANDPHLSLNTPVAEITTDDSIDPDSTGFIVNQVAATNINVNAATYIFLSFA